MPSYTPATSLPLLYFPQWGTPDSPNPALSAPLSPTDTTAYFTTPLLDHAGNKITGSVLIGIKNSDSYVMTCYIAPGGFAADGLSATIVQGIRLEGLDYTTSDPTLIPAEGFSAGDSVFCNISGIIQALTTGAIKGTIATNGLGFIMGDGTSSDVTISHKDNVSTKGFLRKHPATSKVQYSNDGSAWVNIDSVTGSNLVANSASDTTPGYLATKLVAGSGITLTTLNPGGNETLQVNADAVPNFTALEDITIGAPVATTATASSVENLINNGLGKPGSLLAFDTGTVTYVSACRVDTGRIAVIYKESGAWNVICGTVAGATQTLVWGTKQTINAGADTVKPSCDFVSAGKVIFTYVDSSHNLQARAATVAGTVFTFGAEVQVKAATITAPAVATVDTDKVMFAFNHGATFGRVSIGTLSGVTLTVDTVNEQQFLASTCTHISAAQSTTQLGLIVFAAASKGSGVAVACGSTTPAIGAVVDFETNVALYCKAKKVSDNTVAVAWRDTTSNKTQARIAATAGTVLTFPTSELDVSTVANVTDIALAAFARGKIFVAGRDATNNKGSIQEVTLSGSSTLALTIPSVDFVATAVDATTALALTSINDNNKLAVLYVDNTSKDGIGQVYQDYSNISLYVGIAQSTVTGGASLNVRQNGIDTNQTGLTLGTTVTSGGIPLGKAVTTTSMEVILDNNNVLTGEIRMYGGATAPSNWLLCDGTSYLRSDYPTLFNVLGSSFGSADATHFNVPDMRGRAPVGAGTGTGGGASGSGLPTGGSALTARTLGAWVGEETHVLTTAELASHTHSVAVQYGGTSNTTAGAGVGYASSVPGTSGSTGSDTAHNTMQPVMTVNFIIKT